MSISFDEVFPAGNPYLSFLGVEVISYGDGKSAMSLVLRPEFMNSWQVLQGGISMTLMDVAMGLAARTLSADAASSVTIDMQTHFLLPAGRAGDTVVARGLVYHKSSTLYFCEAQLWNRDKLVAKSTGNFKTIKRIDAAKHMVPKA
jgi:acyl-CoA thioesterase